MSILDRVSLGSIADRVLICSLALRLEGDIECLACANVLLDVHEDIYDLIHRSDTPSQYPKESHEE